jgi:protein CpxP
MNKNKLLIFLIAGLLISNILLIVFMMNGRGPGHGPPHHEGPRQIIIERLHFDEAQIKQYELLIQDHRKSITNGELQLQNLKNTLYSNLRSPENKTVTDSLINSITAVQNKIEHVHYAHFEDIKKLCKPEQLNDFNELAGDLAKLFGPPPPPHNKPH